MQWLYIQEFINHLGFFFFLDVDNSFRSRIVERHNLDAHKNFYGPCKETAATIFTQGLDLQTCAELTKLKKKIKVKSHVDSKHTVYSHEYVCCIVFSS